MSGWKILITDRLHRAGRPILDADAQSRKKNANKGPSTSLGYPTVFVRAVLRNIPIISNDLKEGVIRNITGTMKYGSNCGENGSTIRVSSTVI